MGYEATELERLGPTPHPNAWKLARRSLEPGTLSQYNGCFVEFLEYVGNRWDLKNEEEVDEALNNFAFKVYEENNGGRMSVVVATKAAVQFYFPYLCSKLALTTMTLKGWKKSVSPRGQGCCPKQVAYAIAFELMETGQFDYGLGVLLSFEAYLQPGDLFGLRVKDVKCSSFKKFGKRHAVLHLGEGSWASVRPYWIVSLLRQRAKARLRSGRRSALMRGDKAKYRKAIREAAQSLKIPFKVTPIMLRNGGATFDTMKGVMSDEEVMDPGRWTSEKGFRACVQLNEYESNLNALTKRQLRHWSRIVEDPSWYFDVPKSRNY